MSQIKFIYFDAGNVLFLFSDGLERLANKYGKTYQDFEKIFRKYDDQVCIGKLSPQELWDRYQDELDIKDENLDFLNYWVQNFTLIKESFDLIEDLNNSKIRVGLISNFYSGVYEKLVENDFFPYTDWQVKIISSVEGLAKPDPKIYQLAEIKAKVKPGEILFIDDKSEFLDPANARGWQTFQFDYHHPKASIEKLRKIIKSRS